MQECKTKKTYCPSSQELLGLFSHSFHIIIVTVWLSCTDHLWASWSILITVKSEHFHWGFPNFQSRCYVFETSRDFPEDCRLILPSPNSEWFIEGAADSTEIWSIVLGHYCLVSPYEHCPSSVEILSDSKTNAFLQYHEWDSLCCTNIFLSVARLLTLLLTLVKVTNHCCCVTWPWQRGGQISYMWPWH